MPTSAGFTPSTYNSATQEADLGSIRDLGGVLYRYVQTQSAITNGCLMCVYNVTSPLSWQVIGANRTTALTGTPAALLSVGIGVATVTNGNYAWVQVSGIHTAVLSTASTLGRWQCASGTNDTCTDATASIARTEAIFGLALTSTSGGVCTVQLRGLV